MLKKVLATCMGAALAVLLVGCAGGSNETESKTEEAPITATDKAAEYTIVGEQAEGNVEVLVTNKTESAITSVELKAADAKDFTDNLVKKGTTVAAGEQFLLCFKPTGTDTAYEMAITLADDSNYTLTELRLSDYKSMDLIVKDGKAFATYTTLSNQTGSSPQVEEASAISEATTTQGSATDTNATQSNATQSNGNSSTLPSDSMDNWTQEQWENSEFVDSDQYRGDAGDVNPEDMEGYQGSDVSD